MSITPLNESVDLKDHYLAFIELENFGIEKELPDERSHIHHCLYSFQLFSMQVVCKAAERHHTTESPAAVRIPEKV